MIGLGFERANSTGSDPGDPGGPNSVNHVYVAADAALDVLLLQRYGGLLGVDASEDGVEPVEVRLDLVLDPNDLPLEFPTE